MPLARLLRVVALLIAMGTGLLVWWVASNEWHHYTRAVASLQAVDELRLSLLAAEMVSRERGPTNGVLGDETPTHPDRQRALLEARGRTDKAFDALQAVLRLDSPDTVRRDLAQQVDAARSALTQARIGVDQTAAIPKAERPSERIRLSVSHMVAVVPQLAPTISTLAGQAQQAFPELGDAVNGARLAAELREYAGLLGSLFTPALTRQQPFSADERAAIERVQGRIDELRFLVNLHVKNMSHPSEEVVHARDQMNEKYFTSAASLLASVLSAGRTDGRYGMDPAGFAARYVPDMNSIFALRDGMLNDAQVRAEAGRAQALRVLAWVSTGSVFLVALLISTMVMVHQRILRPLADTTRALHALARGSLEAEIPVPVAQDEMAEVLGAVRSLRKHTEERRALERERDELIDRLRDQSNTDFLTGLPNRRAFYLAAERELSQAHRHAFDLVTLMLDVDNFKQVNDTYGHAVGDQVLVDVATVVRRSMREGDLVARYGGEEFVMLLPHCDESFGLRFAERLREAIASIPIACGLAEPLRVTVSLGLSYSVTRTPNLPKLISRADAAMYAAKQSGRNRVMRAPEEA